jgi:mannose-6-phosphate isomerase
MSQQSIQRGQDLIGPFTLEPIFQERIWGVETLPDWYPQPAAGKPIGEAWLTAETCIASDGALKGVSLAELTRRYPEAFAGGALGEFPLLIKTLFPREKLSVQVHPNDAEAQALGQPRGKTECWYVLSAEPGATVAVGFHEELTREQIRTAIEDKTLEDKLRYLPVKAGDMVYVDAGTVHAIGPGMVVLETQQYSDITYRLYDYGRPRELHVDAGLGVSKANSDAGLATPVEMDGFVRLVQSVYFAVDRFSLTENVYASLGESGRMQMLFAMGEGCSVVSDSASMALEPGRIVVLPSENVEYRLRAASTAEIIRILQP